MENKEKKMLTTEDLNRTLGKKELYSIAFGHVIGSGVFSLIGIGIGCCPADSDRQADGTKK